MVYGAKILNRDVVMADEFVVSASPKAKDWLGRELYQYEGIWLLRRQLRCTVGCRTHHFTAQPSDILLPTFPKTGTTWLKALTFALVNRFQHPPSPHKDDDGFHHHPLLRNSPHDLVPFLELQMYDDKDQIVDLSGLPPPRLFGGHLPWFSLSHMVEQVACKVVFICRNPKDTFVSYFHFTNKRRTEAGMEIIPLEEMLDDFCSGVVFAGPYWDFVLEYWRASLKSPDKVLFLRYEELKEEPRSQLRRLAQFLGFPFSQLEEATGVDDKIINLCTFENLKSREVNMNGKLPGFEIPNNFFFRRGEDGDWKNLLTPEMAQKLDQITSHKFEPDGLKL